MFILLWCLACFKNLNLVSSDKILLGQMYEVLFFLCVIPEVPDRFSLHNFLRMFYDA